MNGVISDVSLSESLSGDIYNNYITALEFVNSNPDYSLVKFREIVNFIVCMIANKNNLDFVSDKIFERIEFLFDCEVIDYSLKENLHAARKLGNKGAHVVPNLNGDRELYESRKKLLLTSAFQAREIIVSIFLSVYSIVNKKDIADKIELSPVGQQEQRELIYKALLSDSSITKLQAGIVCETIFKDQNFKSGAVVSHRLYAHLISLKESAINFFNASCEISANIDEHVYENKGTDSDESIVLRYADTEALFKFGSLAISEDNGSELNKKAISRIKSAADRKYGPAESFYGRLLYDDGDYNEALKYLERAENKDEALSLQTLFLYYTEDKACKVNVERAMGYIERAIDLGCPDSIAYLGEAYHAGRVLPKDDKKAESLLKESIDLGSLYGKNYYIIDFNDLAGSICHQFKVLADYLEKKPANSYGKVGRNSLCPCGSSRKYKKCCGI